MSGCEEGGRVAPKFPLRLERVKAAPRQGVASTRGAATAQGPAAARPTAAQGSGVLERSAAAARAVAPPTGLGLDSAEVRVRMVARLRAQGVRDERVLAALQAVPRHLFVDSALATQAYENTSLPIGLGQTISKPSVVARMIELLMAPHAAPARPRLLEIGTGCGYQALVLAQLARLVVSVERLKPLHEKAREQLAALRKDNLRLVYGDGQLGHAPNAPYDGIIAAAGGDDIPKAWLDQLACGGRLVAPMQANDGAGQVLVVVDRDAQGRLHRVLKEPVRFVPLKSGVD